MQPSNNRADTPLFQPAHYFPLRNGRYTVAPALHRLGADFGNGSADTCLFQVDTDFPRFRANKLLCRAERFSKYVCETNLTSGVREAVACLLRERLTTEWPEHFSWNAGSDRSGKLVCHLTGETLQFDLRMRLVDTSGPGRLAPPYADALDALCCQFPEDLAVICRNGDTGEDWVAKLHLCAPSHWAAENKIGKSWSSTHDPVPGMERSRKAADSIVRVMVEREPTVRFTWGIEFDDRLNHHPEPPMTTDPASWNHRGVSPAPREPFYLRVERQVIWGLPAVNAAVFTIRVYHTPASILQADTVYRKALQGALLSMREESRQYKGLAGCFGKVLSYLSGPV